MRTEVLALVVALGLGTSCRTDPKHPTGALAVGTPPGPTVAKVDGRTITAAEATRFAATHDDATADSLIARERKVSIALAQEADVSLARKRAMVQALLADEIEGKVGPDSVPPERLEVERQRVRAELTPMSGFLVTSVRVGSIELIKNRKDLSPERIAELEGLIKEAGERLYAEVPADDGVDVVTNLQWKDWLDPALLVELTKELRVVDIADNREPQSGWVRSNTFAAELEKLEDGQKTSLIDMMGVRMFAVRVGRIEPQPMTDEEVDKVAEARALTEGRKARLDELLGSLRDRTAIAIHPELLEEGP